jgi:ubiquinone/menaquinone biosynthesis C-methylase UbiE
MATAVSTAVWKQAQSGHFETWQGFAGRREADAPTRRMIWEAILTEVTRVRPFEDGERVLDIGCGLDTVLDYLPGSRGFTLDSLMARLRPLGLTPRAQHTAGLFESLPFRDASFDRIFLMNVLDHVRSPEAGLAELARVLRPGGLLLLSVDVYEGRRYRVKKARKWYDRLRGARTKHPWVFSKEDVKHLLRRTGFAPGEPHHVKHTKERRTFVAAERL